MDELNLSHDDIFTIRLICFRRDNGMITYEDGCKLIKQKLSPDALRKIGEPMHVFRMWNRHEI